MGIGPGVRAPNRPKAQFRSPRARARCPPAEQAARVALDSANRWTDNVFTLQSWSKKKFAGMEGQLDGFFKQVSSFPGAQGGQRRGWWLYWVLSLTHTPSFFLRVQHGVDENFDYVT